MLNASSSPFDPNRTSYFRRLDAVRYALDYQRGMSDRNAAVQPPIPVSGAEAAFAMVAKVRRSLRKFSFVGATGA